jgi:uncharacterized protein YciI
MKYVLFYETADDVDSQQLMTHFPAHQARWQEYRERGSLLLIGPFSDRAGAMAVFASLAAAEEFAAGDPFVLNGLMKDWYIREWMEALQTP